MINTFPDSQGCYVYDLNVFPGDLGVKIYSLRFKVVDRNSRWPWCLEAGRTFVGGIGLDKGVGAVPSSGEDGQVAHVFPVCDTLGLCQVPVSKQPGSSRTVSE